MAANTIITSVVTGGSNNHATVAEEVNNISTDFVSQGVVGAITLNTGAGGTGSFCVNQDTSPDMGITVKAGQAYISATPSSQDAQVLRARASSDYTAYTISANSSGSTKYDWIYLKVDPTKANNPASDASDVTSIFTSRSTSNSTDNGSPPTYGLLLAIVTVANGASSIINSNITDKRFNASIGAQTGSLIVTQQSTGLDAIIQAAGIDANVALSLKSKGTGAIKFTPGSSGITGMVENLSIPYKFSVYLNTAQSINNTTAKVAFDTKTGTGFFDTGSNFDVATNHRFTAPVEGYYQLNWAVGASGATTGFWIAYLYKNGASIKTGSYGGSATNFAQSVGSAFVLLAASDYLEVFLQTSGNNALSNTALGTRFEGYLVSIL